MAEHADPQQAQLAEYESQLADVNEMLSLDPNEESLIKLRDDLTELISLTKSEMPGKTEDAPLATTAAPVADKLPPPPPTEAIGPAEGLTWKVEAAATKAADVAADVNTPTPAAQSTKKKKKKSKSSAAHETFEVPDHLKALPSDTDAERKRKSRTVKALKSKWRERKKEAEGIEKQKSWKDFMGKKKKGGSKRDRSIFATEEGVNAKVGVISGTSGVRGNMTEFDGKKRHKH